MSLDHRFLVSLDGVIQPDSDPSTATTNAANAPVDGAAAGVLSGGTTAVDAGRKRRLFKAFKPPARRAIPPPAQPSDDDWRLPPGRMDQLRNGDRNGDHGILSSGARDGGREVLPPRASYTGFGHVESLWDDDDEESQEQQEQGRRDGGATGSVGLAGEGNTGWGMGAGTGCGSACGGSGGGSSRVAMFPDTRCEGEHPQQQQRMQMQMQSSSTSTAAAVVGNASDGMWGQEDSRRAEMRNTRPPQPLSPRSASGVDGDFDFALQQHERPRYADPTHSDQDDPASYESHRSGDGGGGTCPSSAGRSTHRRGAQGMVVAGGGHRHYYPGHGRFDGDGSSVQRGACSTEEPFGCNAASEYDAGVCAPEIDRDPPRGGGGKLRSTQDILSLFGGIGGTSSTNGDLPGHGSQEQRGQQETAAIPLLEPRGSDETSLEHGGTGSTHMPGVGGGISRAADMRRAQKAARVAAAGEATAGEATTLSVATAEAGESPATCGGDASADWACGVCGVRGGASLTSCRVCGAKRQAPQNGGDGRLGGVHDLRGDLRIVNSSDKQRGWREIDFQAEKWEDQEWEGVAEGKDNAHAGGGVQDDDRRGGLGGGGADTIFPEGPGVMGLRRRSSSPSRSAPSSHTGGEGGSKGTAGRSTPGSSSKHRMIGVRMQMDMGLSSDSDEA